MENKVDKKIIGFDLDGVILDFTDLKIKLAAEHGFELKPEQTPSDVFSTILPRDILKAVQAAMYGDPEVAVRTSLNPGIKNVLQGLTQQSVPFVLISRRRNIETAVLALKHHGLWGEYFDDKNTYFVVEKADKNTKSVELGVTHYIDDETAVLAHLVDVPHRYLMDPFKVSPPADYKIVSSLEEFYNYLNI